MKSTFIDQDDALAEFRSEFVQRTGNPLSDEYLFKARFRAFYKAGELVGGYAINSNPPLRYLQWVPESARDDIEIINSINRQDAAEITCIWIKKGGVTRLERNWIYVMSTIDALRENKKWILGGSISRGVARIQKQVLSRGLYNGPTTLPNSPIGEIYCASRSQVALTMARLFIVVNLRDIFSLIAKKIGVRKRRLATPLQEQEVIG